MAFFLMFLERGKPVAGSNWVKLQLIHLSVPLPILTPVFCPFKAELYPDLRVSGYQMDPEIKNPGLAYSIYFQACSCSIEKL